MRWSLASMAAAVLVVTGAATIQSPATAGPAPAITTSAVTSFDGTPIVATLFVPPTATPADPAPLVLLTHGWAGTGQRTASGFVSRLLDDGYIVLTWDQRGFGCSGGTVGIAKPAFEGRDVSALIDHAVASAPVATDAGGDPLVGMSGGSYAGGIQTAAASLDGRIDAIAPEISWSDLRYTLFGGEVVNQGWALLLYAAGLPTATGLGLDPNCPTFPQAGTLDPAITVALAEGAATSNLSDASRDFLGASSLAVYGASHPVAIPTLVIQGSVDTLFDLSDGYGVYQHVLQQGAPARFVVFCGGHVACPADYADADDGAHVDAAILDWFQRHLRGDETVDVGPPVEYRTNEGVWRSADAFGPSTFTTATGAGRGSLVSIPTPDLPDVGGLVDTLIQYGGGLPALPVTSAQLVGDGDPRAMTVPLGAAGDEPLDVVGIPTVRLEVSGVGTEVVLLAKLVDRESGAVVNLQEGGVRVSLLDGPVTVEVPMPGVAYTVPAGHHLDLQVSTASVMHATARTPATVDVVATASVPVSAAVVPIDAADVGATTTVPPGEPIGRSSGSLPATGGRPVPGMLLVTVAMVALVVRWANHAR
jgi:ABC-2 type transport system ATP-binding protein